MIPFFRINIDLKNALIKCRITGKKERKIVVCKIEIIGKSIYDGKIIDLVKHFDKIPKSHIRELSCHQYKIIEILPDKEKEIEELER